MFSMHCMTRSIKKNNELNALTKLHIKLTVELQNKNQLIDFKIKSELLTVCIFEQKF